MKKPAINYSWPVILSDFSQDSVNENFSRAKLWVYYKGETADHRYFSDDFAEKINATLPYTPVVSYYDEEKEDFVGHANQQQIYGIVDPCVEPTFAIREDDGKEWCVAEVVLYTERPDKVGDIAKKIVGQPHSLELNPKTVKYVINYDEKKHFKNIEFTAGDFVGVSVLGKNQKPAFTGSAFFEANEEFENKMKLLHDYCAHKDAVNDSETNGGESMNLEEFMKLSWGDISAKVDHAISREYANDAYTYVVDMFEDSAIVRFYYYVGGDQKLMRVKYSCSEDGEVTLGSVNEVRIAYEDVVESPSAEINMEQVEEPIVTEEVTTDAVSECTIDTEIVEEETTTNAEITEHTTEEEVVDSVDNPEDSGEFAGKEPEDEEEKDNKDVKDDQQDTFEDTTSEPAQVTNVEITPTTETKVSVDDEQNSTNQEIFSSSTSFTESERAEFEALKRKEKVDLIDSYKESLTDEQYADFIEKVDSFTKDSLELELLRAYKRKAVEDEDSSTTMRAFAFSPINNANNNESTLDAFVRKHRR